MTNRRFSDEEFLVAGIGFLGLLLMILGGLTLGFGTNDGSEAQLFLFAGAFLMILAIVLWLFITRPWESYDDLKTPYYTGHDHHDEHAEAVAVAEPAEVVADVKVATAAVDKADVEKVVETAPEAVKQKKTKAPPAKVKEAVARVDEAEAEEVAEVAEEVMEKAVQTETPKEVKEAEAAVDEADEEPPDKVVITEEATEFQARETVEDALEKEAATPAASGEPQDLRAIQGIGPKTQDALYAEGITTYAQIAALSAEQLETIIKEKHGVRIRAGATESWPKQAQFLADGDADGLAAYQSSL